jgi:hypothetical protein
MVFGCLERVDFNRKLKFNFPSLAVLGFMISWKEPLFSFDQARSLLNAVYCIVAVGSAATQ